MNEVTLFFIATIIQLLHLILKFLFDFSKNTDTEIDKYREREKKN